MDSFGRQLTFPELIFYNAESTGNQLTLVSKQFPKAHTNTNCISLVRISIKHPEVLNQPVFNNQQKLSFSVSQYRTMLRTVVNLNTHLGPAFCHNKNLLIFVRHSFYPNMTTSYFKSATVLIAS